MAVAYPLDLRTIIQQGKSRSRAASFAVSDPAAGYAYAQASGTDRPIVWDVKFRFDGCDAIRFQMWFTQDLQRGVLDFTLPIKTELGVVQHTCRFMPEGLLSTREDGEVWEYTAQIVSRG